MSLLPAPAMALALAAITAAQAPPSAAPHHDRVPTDVFKGFDGYPDRFKSNCGAAYDEAR
jgi:hypothetical protein